MDHLWAQLDGDKQTVSGAPSRCRGITIRPLNLSLYGPSNRSNHTGQWEDGFWFLGLRLGVE